MDWDGVIEKNREALKRIVAALAAMASLAGGRLTLPRHLHRAVLRLLRPAEAAARRLVIVVALGVVVEPPSPRKPRADTKAAHAVLRSLGLAVVMSPADPVRAAAGKFRRPHPVARSEVEPRRAVLPLFDPPYYPFCVRRRTVSPHAAPRILSFNGARPHRLPPPPAPDDPIDATRLKLRLEALASALNDLPKHARRFARWTMARDAAGAQDEKRRERGLVRRLSPLRPGQPPGGRSARSRQPAHEVHDVLADMQSFALHALRPADTS